MCGLYTMVQSGLLDSSIYQERLWTAYFMAIATSAVGHACVKRRPTKVDHEIIDNTSFILSCLLFA